MRKINSNKEGIKVPRNTHRHNRASKKDKDSVKLRSKRKSRNKNYGNYVDSDILEQFELIEAPENASVAKLSDSNKPENLATRFLEPMVKSESPTSDTKQNGVAPLVTHSMVPMGPQKQLNLLNNGLNKDTSLENHHNQISDEIPVHPINLSLKMADEHEPASSSKLKRASFSGGRNHMSGEHGMSDFEIDGNIEPHVPPFELSKDPNEEHKYPNHQFSKDTPQFDSEAKYDLLHENLYKYTIKTDNVLSKLGSCMQSFQLVSSDKKVELIYRSWTGLSSTNQKVLKTLMKNQFNIDLSLFKMDPEEPENQRKMNLKFVKPTIIESLYQEIDMLS